jgi:fused signal recognition particle receptor
VTDLLSRWRDGLSRTSTRAFGQLAAVLGATEITPSTWEELEELLIQADVGIPTAEDVVRHIQGAARESGIRRSSDLKAALKKELLQRLSEPKTVEWASPPEVLLIVGVNGSGKTTTIAKLAKYFGDRGKKVLLGAADTFRAAAKDQLGIWAQRLEIDMISGAPESDPGAVAYNTVQAGIARGADLMIIDTAGRLHTRSNLMEELKKVRRVVGKALPGAPQAVWLVLDATSGQNVLAQARAFKEAVGVTGVVLAKLDASARGGMAFAVQQELGLPILFVGLGEELDDLEPFDRGAFVDGILGEAGT